MQLVHFTDKAIGSFDWELPTDIASLLGQLPPGAQTAVLHELQQLTKAHLFTMIATLKMGYAAEAAFDLIRNRSAAMSRELIAMAQEEIRKAG